MPRITAFGSAVGLAAELECTLIQWHHSIVKSMEEGNWACLLERDFAAPASTRHGQAASK